MMGYGGHNSGRKDTSYDEFKQVSVIEEVPVEL